MALMGSAARVAIPDTAADTPVRGAGVTDSLLRNPRFPNDRPSPWLKRWRAFRSNLTSHPHMGAAWLFALASVGAGIACALLAAWMQ
jgi:hypothetical protein